MSPRPSGWAETAALKIYQAYPDHDLLPVDPPRPGETIREFKERTGDVGDTLFQFLCREADDDIDADEYVVRLNRAIRDIESVREGFRRGSPLTFHRRITWPWDT